MQYRLVGAYGECEISRHDTRAAADDALLELSWYERSAPRPHDAHVEMLDVGGEWVRAGAEGDWPWTI